MSIFVNRRKNINLEKVCRVCLTEGGSLRGIHPTKLPKMIENCASVQVSEDDGLPGNVCVKCFHLITKLYIFKKKLERSDRILRQYVKNLKIKSSNIIDIALNEADITYKQDDSELSEEDIPLSERLLRRNALDDLRRLDILAKSENLQELEITESTIEGFKSEDTVQIFTDGPPPLVPLAPIDKSSYNESVAKNLPNDTPPLVPIKPLVNVDILENIIEKNDDIKYQCNTCNIEFTSVLELKEHKVNICQQSNLKCNICRKEFKESKKLIGHLKGHMISKDYGCKICGKCYPNPSTFRVHMRTHTGERPFKCQICSKGFVRWAGVVGHMRTHEDHKPFKCDTCDKSFKVASNLERHKILHSGSLPYCCNYCGKFFSQSDNLQLHIRTYHTNERPYLCSECGKSFVTSTRLNRHMWIHSGYKPHMCSSCPKSYSNSVDLKNHERIHLGKKSDEDKLYACDLCDMKFYHPCRLVRHKKIHQKTHACHICNKTYSTEAALRRHIQNKHKIIYLEESMLHPDEGVSQIFVQYRSPDKKSDETLECNKNDPLKDDSEAIFIS